MPISRFSDCVVVPLPQEEKKVTPPRLKCTVLAPAPAPTPIIMIGPPFSRCALSLSLSYFITRSNASPLTFPPAIALLTFLLNRSLSLIKSFAASLFNGSLAFGSRNKNCNPTITAFKLSTGFQSSRRMFKQTLPSRSMLGW